MSAMVKLKSRYEVKERLGQGGMGAVFRAYDRVTRHDVAVKTLRDRPEKKVMELFHKECEILAKISHPNIVDIFDIGEWEENGEMKPFFVMPYLNGVTLESLIRSSSNRLTVDRSVEIITQTCRGLQAAHEQGVIHRDLKPGNIFVMPDDSVKVIDFGVARMASGQTTSHQMGTLHYMSPEQIQMKSLTAVSDLFSLGVICYEIFSRRRPFQGNTESELVEAILQQVPPPVSAFNPAVNRMISQVIHKSMAKQPWNRFPSARDFSEILQKAFRNEPIEMFDLERIQPRLQRASSAFEKGDYQFVGEILSELEAEGHLDDSIILLRHQVDQAQRQQTLQQLMSSARRRFEEEEYPLALQKVQEILDLDPNNPEAITLRENIESRRTQKKIEDWFRLARQHISHYSFHHARQAIENVLQLKPKDTQAQQLLSEVDRLEQEYLRIRQQKEQAYQAALEAWQKGDVSSALTRLEKVMQLDRVAPDLSSPEQATTYQDLYNKVRSEHDGIRSAYEEAKTHLAGKNYSEALAVCQKCLSKYPNHALFQALKYDIEEQERQDLSAYIVEINHRIESEPDLDRRFSIIQEAAARFPEEAHFGQTMRRIRDKRDLVNSIVSKARLLEENSQFNEALGQWEILQSIYNQYPGLTIEIQRLCKRRDQQVRAEAKGRLVEKVDGLLEAGQFEEALNLLEQARPEFPQNEELSELEKLGQQGMARIKEAERLVVEGQDLFLQGKIVEGVEVLQQASQLNERDSSIKKKLADALVEQARLAIDTNWESVEPLVQQALQLVPDHAMARSLQTLVLDHQRQQQLDRLASQVRQLQVAGDLRGALAEVVRGLKAFPQENMLLQLQMKLNKQIGESRRKALDELKQAVVELASITEESAVIVLRERLQAVLRLWDGDVEMEAAISDWQQRLRRWKPFQSPAGKPPEPAKPLEVRPPAIPLSPPKLDSMETERTMLRPSSDESAAGPLEDSAPKVSPISRLVRLVQAKLKKRRVETSQVGEVQPQGTPLRAKPWKLVSGVILIAGILAALFGVWQWYRSSRQASEVSTSFPVEFQTTPASAQILINNKETGTSPLRHVLTPGSYQIDVFLPGYAPLRHALNLSAPLTTPLMLTLQPLPLNLILSTDLEKGKVWLDDQLAGELINGQLLLENLSPGSHSLRLQGGRSEMTLAFEFQYGSLPVVQNPSFKEVQYLLVSTLGSRMKVLSSLAPFPVTLDSQSAGTVESGGLEVQKVASGLHTLALERQPQNWSVQVECDRMPRLMAFLNSDRNVGQLSVVTGEDNVLILLNGKETRLTQRGQLQIANLEVKEYEVQAKKEGFFSIPEKQKVKIQKAQMAKLAFTLKPAVSELRIQDAKEWAGAGVFLDGRSVGNIQADGAFQADNLPPGEHRIELRKDKFKPKALARQFTPGETVQVGGHEWVAELTHGKIQLLLSPSNSRVMMQARGQVESLVHETSLELPEGTYTFAAQASGYSSRSETIDLTGGSTAQIDLTLSPLRAAVQNWMIQWSDPNGWKQDREWHVRQGGGFILFNPSPLHGILSFTLSRGGKAKQWQWVTNFIDSSNYTLFSLDKKSISRVVVQNGKKQKPFKVAHNLSESAPEIQIKIEVSGNMIQHQVQVGERWNLLDGWSEEGRDLSLGKFGFYLPGSDQLRLSNFKYTQP
jgi:eukaryotic-like serine/threonine-protein kinase